MNPNPLLLSFFLTLSLAGVAAQESLPLPQLPLKTPANACWIVYLDSSQNSTGNDVESDSPRQFTRFDHSGDYIRIRAFEGDLLVSEYWIFKNGQSIAYPGGGTLVVTQLDEQSMEADWANGKYPDFAWLDVDNYKGVVSHNGRTCHHFSDVASPPEQDEGVAPPPIPASAFSLEAWIDVESSRPVSVKFGDSVRTYEFPGTPPDLQMGADMRSRLQAIEANRKAYDERHAMP